MKYISQSWVDIEVFYITDKQLRLPPCLREVFLSPMYPDFTKRASTLYRLIERETI